MIKIKIVLADGTEVETVKTSAKVFINGAKFTNNNGSELEIIGALNSKEYVCKFNDGTLIRAYGSNISKGKVSNKNDKTVCGRGYIGYGEFNGGKNKKEYILWNKMFQRCYGYGNSGAIVYEEWCSFQVFCSDIKKLKGYSLWNEDSCNIHLDKDVICERDGIIPKVYSLNTCMFITAKENMDESRHRCISAHLTGDIYIATRINDGYIEEFINQSKFARDNNLSQGHIGACLRGERKTHKGWKFNIKENNDENI